VNWAASLGDRSENADYQYNKQILRKIDRRVRYLGKRLEELKIIDFSPEQEGKVYFGAWVDIENEDGEQKTLRIVGVDEIYDHHPQHISIDSPMARALLGKQVDDEVKVLTPSGEKLWYVNEIRYEKPENSAD
jgi:transcription elongation factor GreB